MFSAAADKGGVKNKREGVLCGEIQVKGMPRCAVIDRRSVSEESIVQQHSKKRIEGRTSCEIDFRERSERWRRFAVL